MSGDAAPAPVVPAARSSLALLPGRARVGLIATMVLLLIGFLSLVWTPWPTGQADVGMQLIDPSLAHPFGTDGQGRDVVSLIMKGMLTSYVVAAVGIAIGLLVGVPIGLATTAAGPLASTLRQWIGDPLAIVPALAIAAVFATVAGPGAVTAMAAIGVATIPVFARIAWRVTSARHHDEPMAASRLAGMSRWDATMRHVLSDLPAVLFAESLLLLGFAVLAEATLSYVGLGAQPAGASLGLMLKEAQGSMLFEPPLILGPGIAIVLMAGALQLAGRGMRAALDERLRPEERDHALA